MLDTNRHHGLLGDALGQHGVAIVEGFKQKHNFALDLVLERRALAASVTATSLPVVKAAVVESMPLVMTESEKGCWIALSRAGLVPWAGLSRSGEG